MVRCSVAVIGLGAILLTDVAGQAQDPAAATSAVYVGVNLREVSDPQARQLGVQADSGAVLTKVWPDSPAEQARLRAGDVIVKCGDRPVNSCADLRALIHGSAPGNRHRVEFYRGTQRFFTELTLGRKPPPTTADVTADPQGAAPFYLGLRATSAGREAAHRLGIESPSGAAIVAVQPGGPAAEAGLQRGDLVTEFGDQEIHNAEDLESAIRRSPPGSSQVLGVVRGQAGLNCKLTIGALPAQPGQTFAHALGGYRLRLPDGWRVERPAGADRPDHLLSREDSYQLFCFRTAREASQPEPALKQFVAEKLAQVPDAQRVALPFARVPAACVAYHGGQPRQAVWRMAFLHNGRRYVINAVGSPLLDLEQLPRPVLEVLQTLAFDSSSEAGPATPPPESPAAEAPPKIPAGWVTKTIAGVTLSVPPDWKASDLAAADEGLWCKGPVLSPNAAFSLVRDTPLDELSRGGKLQREGELRLGRLSGQRYTVEVQRGERPEKGLIVIVKLAGATNGTVALTGFAPATEWETYRPLLEQMLACVRFAESP
jgi:hypothetical protein